MKKLIFVIAITLLFSFGCSPKQDYGKIYEVNGKITSLTGCSEQYKRCLSTTELLSLLGEPEKKIQVKDFHGLVLDDWGASKEPEKCADDELRKLYKRYLYKYKPAGESSISTWNSNEQFLDLDLWFYVFHSGPKVTTGGVFPKSTGMFNTYYYVVKDDQVILARSYLRPIDKKHK